MNCLGRWTFAAAWPEAVETVGEVDMLLSSESRKVNACVSAGRIRGGITIRAWRCKSVAAGDRDGVG